MGTKLFLDMDDPFLNGVVEKPVGMSGGCYCCGRQLHIEFESFKQLPNARIDGDLFHILICDDCETDTYDLEEDGIEDVSYDVLFQLQEDLQAQLNELQEIHDVQEEDRFDILKKLYLKHEIRYRKLKG